MYNYRIFDRYDCMVVSLAVLADVEPAWRPDCFVQELWGCRASLCFPTVKLADFRARWQVLEQEDNPFAAMVMAHLRTQETRGDPQKRLDFKVWLTEWLQRSLKPDAILDVHKLLDWLMALPGPLQREYEDIVDQARKEGKMPYMTVWERRGIEQGLAEGKQQGLVEGKQQGLAEGEARGMQQAVIGTLELRFKSVAQRTRQTVQQEKDLDRLRELLRQAINAESLEAFEAELFAGKDG